MDINLCICTRVPLRIRVCEGLSACDAEMCHVHAPCLKFREIPFDIAVVQHRAYKMLHIDWPGLGFGGPHSISEFAYHLVFL